MLRGLLVYFIFTATLMGCQSMRSRRQHEITDGPCASGLIEIPLHPQAWTVEYSGYGRVEFAPQKNELWMSPQGARTPQATHASLVLSHFKLDPKSFHVVVEYQNLHPLRTGTANPWEVFWLFFQYQKQPSGLKSTNYVIAKTNGLEMGRASGTNQQDFLKTTDSPKADFNRWHRLELRRSPTQLSVILDDEKAFDWEIPSPAPSGKPSAPDLFDQEGQLGLYTEDAEVLIRKVCLRNGP